MEQSSLIWYRPGISFENTPMPIRSVSARKTALVRYGGPKAKRGYRRRLPIWRRSGNWRRFGKMATNRKLGYTKPELASYDEHNLGALTVNSATSTFRNSWGALSNLFTQVGDFAIQKEQRKTMEAESRLAALRAQAASSFQYTKESILSNPTLLLVGGGVILTTLLVLKRKKARRR
jgi:hypothetical protein